MESKSPPKYAAQNSVTISSISCAAWHKKPVDLNQLYETQTSFRNMLYSINSLIHTMTIFTHRINVIIKTCVSHLSFYFLSRKKLFEVQKFLKISTKLIRAKGYEVKGEDFGEKAHKFISFRPLDRERFVRGSAKSLGAEYTKERIKERIEEKALVKDKKRVPFPTRKKPIVKDYSRKNLIDSYYSQLLENNQCQ